MLFLSIRVKLYFMVKKSIFLFLSGLVFLTLILYFRLEKQKEKAVENQVHQSLSTTQELSLTNYFQPLTWNISDIKITKKVKLKQPLSVQTEEEKKPLWEYISFSRCEPDPKAPDYLHQRFQKTTGKNTNALPTIDCGFIRTKIPFSF